MGRYIPLVIEKSVLVGVSYAANFCLHSRFVLEQSCSPEQKICAASLPIPDFSISLGILVGCMFLKMFERVPFQ